MIKKLWKIVLLLVLMLGVCMTYVSASDINLNLPGTDANQEVNNTQNENDVGNSTINNTPAGNENDANANEPVQDQNQGIGDDTTVAPTDTETLQPTTVASNSNSGLSATNIINILLITVGVILILLSIAIIIRLK